MKTQHAIILALSPLAFAGAASAAFTGFVVESSFNAGLAVYRVSAQFTTGNDTLSWNPNFVIGAANDSYLCIGGPAVLGGGNTTLADAGWINGWNTPAINDLPSTGIAGWYNSLTENMQGKANANGRVLIGQFVLETGHSAKVISLNISHNTTFGSPVSESQGTFTLVPAPGALALLALAGVAARRRR